MGGQGGRSEPPPGERGPGRLRCRRSRPHKVVRAMEAAPDGLAMGDGAGAKGGRTGPWSGERAGAGAGDRLPRQRSGVPRPDGEGEISPVAARGFPVMLKISSLQQHE